jgi:hypothetical protein
MNIESYLKILNSIGNLFLSNIFKLSIKDLIKEKKYKP